MENKLPLYNLLYDKNNPLLFNSGLFLILFTVFLVFYTMLKNRKTMRTVYVIVFSLYFYYKTSGDFVILLFGSVIVNYIFGMLIDSSGSQRIRKFNLIFGLIVNLTTLSFFKYTNLIIDNLNLLMKGNLHNIEIFLPIGISFFTFQQIAYLTDVYRENLKPSENFLDYTFFVTFFPYLIAGPIVRGGDLLPQNKAELPITKDYIDKGFYLILRGLIKKAFLAYYISQYCDLIFDSAGNYSGFENLVAVYAYALEIYLDFSGYSDMAIGIASVMGFTIKDNFNEPYKAFNLIDFWKRWHISLSTWLRDYLFLPLNYFYLKRSKYKKISILNSYIFATIFTMTIAGIWHGSSNKFFIWGLIYGVGLVINQTFHYIVKKKIRKKIIPDFAGTIITFHIVTVLWLLFRSPDINHAMSILNNITGTFDINYLIPFFNARGLFTVIFVLSFILIYLPQNWKNYIMMKFYATPLVLKALMLIIVLQLIIQIQTENIQPFIYFQF